MPRNSRTASYGREAQQALARVRRLTAKIKRHDHDYAERLDAYDEARRLGVLFSDIASAAECSDAAVMTALKNYKAKMAERSAAR